MFWWKYKEKRKVSKIDDDSKPEELGGGVGGKGTPLHNPFTYEVIPNGMVTEPLWSEILFINSL